jgi:predicted dehydrogenase
MSKRFRAAILGYGRSGSTMHAGAYAANADAFDVVAVCDIDPERRKQASERFGCTVYNDYHAMLESEDLDIVSVVTRSDQHCAMACDCLNAGVNVLVTKPWAVNAEEGKRMVAVSRESGSRLFPWLPARWGTVFLRLQELVRAGAVGRVFTIRRAQSSFATRADWQSERRHGGGYLLNWGPHIVDPAILLGDAPVRTVYGSLKQTINPGDAEDVFLAVIELANDVSVVAEYTISTEDLPNWFIQGDRGTIVVTNDRHIRVSKKTPSRPDDPTVYATMKAGEQAVDEEDVAGAIYGDEKAIYAELADALRNQSDYPVPPEDALALSQVFDAVRTSHDEKRVVAM